MTIAKVAVFLVVVALVAISVAAAIQIDNTPDLEPQQVALAESNCQPITGGEVCYDAGRWWPRCFWPYIAVFPKKICRLGNL